MKQPHKHAELIKAWADGAEIEWQSSNGTWVPSLEPTWNYPEGRYRIKPEPKPDVVIYPETATSWEDEKKVQWFVKGQLKLIFDCETGKLKSAEVI